MEFESVQPRFTRLVDGIGLFCIQDTLSSRARLAFRPSASREQRYLAYNGLLPYKDRLKKLRITTLIERRARGDIIELFKTFRGMCSYGSSLFKLSRSGMNIVLTKMPQI